MPAGVFVQLCQQLTLQVATLAGAGCGEDGEVPPCSGDGSQHGAVGYKG